jgi:glutathione synthase/RimK-type ligase-like ATP-grasp enzyme
MKPFQLAVAKRLGLTTPRTLVTNDQTAASAFIQEIGLERTVYKVLVSDAVCWRETRRLRPEELVHLNCLRHAPAIFQEHVDGPLDIRATVVGNKVFAAAIDATATSYPQDYRMDLANAVVRKYQLPDRVSGLLVRLCGELGLAYAAADFRVTPDGEHVFLELNPAGQWLFIEHSTGMPIGAALADLLSSSSG